MKRSILLVVAMVMTLGVSAGVEAYNPYAPNQFESMDRNTWEYQYLYDLTKDGVTGASIGKFDATYQLTRYEMTQMVETALARRSKATPAQQEKIDRLAKAFATDLQYMNPTPVATPTEGQSMDWRHQGGTEA